MVFLVCCYLRAITFLFIFEIILVINKQIVSFLLYSYYLRKLWGGERAFIRQGRLFEIMNNGVSAYSGTGAY